MNRITMKRAATGVSAHVALLNSRWAQGLSDELRRRVLAETTIRSISVGGFVCRKGESAEHWIGVLDGLVKVASVSPEGKSVSFIAVPTGGWFGEVALLKLDRRLYDAVALRNSVIALVPRNTFM